MLPGFKSAASEVANFLVSQGKRILYGWRNTFLAHLLFPSMAARLKKDLSIL